LTSPVSAVDFWVRYRAGWHVLAGAVFLLVGVFVAVDDATTPARRLAALGLLAALLGWYAVVGTRALRCAGDRLGDRLGLGYFAGVLVMLAVVYAMTMTAAFLLFALSPQVFVMVRRWRTRLTLQFLLYGEVAAVTVVRHGFTGAALGRIAVEVLLPMVFALLIGAYITGIVEQSRDRGALIDELTRTREELAAERHAAGVHAERERLAAEIHDTLAQGFTSILMLTQAARVALDRASPPGAVATQLDLVERTARENLAEARALVAALSPPDLADRTLADALVRLAERHTRDTGVPVSVAVDGPPAGPAPETDVVLLRAAQEALSNIGRHAAASAVRIELSHDAGTAAVAVIDDGRGFDPGGVSGGYGLLGVRNRATAFGGTCSVRSSPGAGTTVRVELPRRAGPAVARP
jgi:signal transduction histidine kinase